MKRIIKKQIKRTVTYTVYKDGTRMLKQDLPEEVEAWIAESYINMMFAKNKLNK